MLGNCVHSFNGTRWFVGVYARALASVRMLRLLAAGSAPPRCQQHHQGARAAVGRTGLHEGQHLLLLHQPALHAALEHGCLARRAQALAMHHTHAAQARAVGQADEFAQRLARLLYAQAVQIQLALDAPLAGAQPARHVQAHAGAAKAQLVIHVQQRAHVELVAQRFAQHARLVQRALHGLGLGRYGLGPVARGPVLERRYGAHRVLEQVAHGACMALGLLPQPGARGLLGGGLLQGAAQGFQVGEGAGGEGGTHGLPVVPHRSCPPRRGRYSVAMNCVTCAGLKLSSLTKTSTQPLPRAPPGSGAPQVMPSMLSGAMPSADRSATRVLGALSWFALVRASSASVLLPMRVSMRYRRAAKP